MTKRKSDLERMQSDLDRLQASNRSMLETRQRLLNWPKPTLPTSGAFPATYIGPPPPLGPPPEWVLTVRWGTQSDPPPLPPGRFRNLDFP